MLDETRALSRASARMHENIMLRIVKLKGILSNPEATDDEKVLAKTCLLQLKHELENEAEMGSNGQKEEKKCDR